MLPAGFAAITVTYIMGGVTSQDSTINPLYIIVLTLETFNEEFLCRGVLFLYVKQKTGVSVAYITSVGTFILMHPQAHLRLSCRIKKYFY